MRKQSGMDYGIFVVGLAGCLHCVQVRLRTVYRPYGIYMVDVNLLRLLTCLAETRRVAALRRGRATGMQRVRDSPPAFVQPSKTGRID